MNHFKIRLVLAKRNKSYDIYIASEIRVSKQTKQYTLRPFVDPCVFETRLSNLRYIGVPEANGQFKYQMHNLKLEALSSILVFSSQEKSRKQVGSAS